MQGNDPVSYAKNLLAQTAGTTGATEQDPEQQKRLNQARELQRINWEVPLAVGAGAHEYQKRYLADQPKFAEDPTGINFQTARQAMDDPNLRFKLKEQYADLAEGGRIGYNRGRVVNPGGYQGEEEGVDSIKHFIMLEQIEKLEKMIASGLDSEGRLQASLDQLNATPTTGFGTGPD